MNKKDIQINTEKYHVPNLERALKILEYLSKRLEGVTMSDVSVALEIPKNSSFRILNTLLAHGYVLRDEKTQKFRLSGKLLGLGSKGTGAEQLLENAFDVLRRLRDESGETTLVGRLIDQEGVVLGQVGSNHPIKVFVELGTRFPLHVAAPAKAMLAYLPTAEQKAMLSGLTLKKYTERTITSLSKFKSEIKKARKLGYAVDWGEEVEGINCVAAPIFDHSGYPIAAIWITGPETRINHLKFENLGSLVMKHASEISARMGFV
ncbi:IclR family transcriptional regulator [uncultured Gimesia sp.]|uniref:IclR family transcriptional regulator n=1 Tax=uncultured Gimesia sp. TaxID=1678688 RepID=UPI0030D885CE|tara:strand:+ start:43501 stop:44289 length:789 start_codon:yes stop_codon:yes gene_type:complete